MATGRDRTAYEATRRRRKEGNTPLNNPLAGGVRQQTKAEILCDAEKLVIKPGMKLVYDEELNMMVWR